MTEAVLNTQRWIAAGGDRVRSARRLAGLAVVAAGLAALTHEGLRAFFDWFAANPAVKPALMATGITAGTTALGALPVLFARQISRRAQDTMLGFGAGVMLAAAAFSLIIPGIDAGSAFSGTKLFGVAMVAAGIAFGSLAMLGLDRVLPHEHFVKGVEGAQPHELKRIWLFVAAIAIHNLPEGLAVGVGFGGGGDVSNGIPLAFGIAVQNMPEGLVVALALIAVGYSVGYAAIVAAATGLLEPVGGLLGAGVLGISEAVLPWGMGFAAGAMIFVVSHEIIPESHRKGHERYATMGLIGGFVLMMMLDTALG